MKPENIFADPEAVARKIAKEICGEPAFFVDPKDSRLMICVRPRGHKGIHHLDFSRSVSDVLDAKENLERKHRKEAK